MEERIPQSWVGEDVLLARTTAGDSEMGTLSEVNEMGLAYKYKAGELAGVPIFVPWSSVSWVRPSVPGDLEEPDAGTEAVE